MNKTGSISADRAFAAKGNLELCHFGSTALLFRPGAAIPYIVAEDYDRNTGEWGSESRFADLATAFHVAEGAGEVTEKSADRCDSSRAHEGSRADTLSFKAIVDTVGSNAVRKVLDDYLEGALSDRWRDDEDLDEMIGAKFEEAELCSDARPPESMELAR